MKKKLLRTDRNGTKYYEGDQTCDRCGGSGMYVYAVINGVPVPTIVDNGICHKCLGKGVVHAKWCERTPEYEAKLFAKRKARLEKKIAEEYTSTFARSLKAQGFDAEGYTWLVLGNTYDIKDELKEIGGKFDFQMGWHLDHEDPKYKLLKVYYLDIGHVVEDGHYFVSSTKAELDKIKLDELKKTEKIANPSYYGNIGDKFSVTVHFSRSSHWESRFGMTFIHVFTDNEGHTFVWKTNRGLDLNPDTEFILSGTVKDHTLYEEVLQTVVTRCKIQKK